MAPSATLVDEPLSIQPKKAIKGPHPLDPLSPAEIASVSQILRAAFPDHKVIFRVITLAEPPKALLAPYLQAERANQIRPKIPRKAFCQYYLNDRQQFHQVEVDIDTGKLSSREELPGKHSYTDAEEGTKAEAGCLAEPTVQAALKQLDLPENAVVVVEPWTYAPDGLEDMSQRIIMCYLHMRLSPHKDANHFAYPLDICAQMNAEYQVTKVFTLPSAESDRMVEWTGTGKKFDRRKIHSSSEYHPDLQKERRTTTTPYQVVQPEGPSFHIEGNLINWEKWRLKVGFNYREGLTIHDVTYDGRELFYRLSLSEMFVPYGDPRSPYPRKAAFDLGNNGAGVNANNLQLGCDCLGTIKYFDAYHHTLSGDPFCLPNVVCCHEQDDGILWKHTNFRTNNAVVTHSRILVLQTIITVNNYEYIFAFHFNQAAEISYEVQATGIVSTNLIDIGDSATSGTVVALGVLAPFHQHLFSLRIDPAIDGHKNSLLVEESYAIPYKDPVFHNPAGIGYTTQETFIEHEMPLDTDVTKARVFKMVNENVLSPVNGAPVGYKLVPHNSQMLLAHPDSLHAKRSEFGAHAVWVTRYHDKELYASGQHTMQSPGGEDGVRSLIQSRKEGVRDEDIVIWHTFGTTHNPRTEESPVMPTEKMMVSLKPVNFFTRNPAIDVAISNQLTNKSVLVTDVSCTGCT
ncbi:amine oxidase [Exophiala viscosa]|uniref:Amine oxidase n=1 Tax=Exophiala viscosa TaxID=2486360 RepID=A0AAN6I871_9EURO|nr:amine oxidase [Exophiala viscosa]